MSKWRVSGRGEVVRAGGASGAAVLTTWVESLVLLLDS